MTTTTGAPEATSPPAITTTVRGHKQAPWSQSTAAAGESCHGTETSSAATDSHQVCDQANNCATAGPYTFMVDKKGPSLSCLGTPVYTLNQAGATVSASVSDGGSGAAASPVSAPAGTSSVGLKSAPVTGYDNVGNPTTVLCPYQVNYNFSGFFPPIDNPGPGPTFVFNVGKSGERLPRQVQPERQPGPEHL